MNEKVLAWLNKQLKSKEMGLYRSLHKVNATETELKNLEDTIDVIRHLIDLVTVDGWMDPEIELPGNPDRAVLVICSGTAGSVRFEDAYELAWYDPKEDGWVLEAYPGEPDIHVSWWAFLPDPPEKKIKKRG